MDLDETVLDNSSYQIDLYKNWYVLISVRENEDSFELRNSIFESYIPAIHEITKRGGFVIRYGNLSGQIKNTNIKNFLDLRGNEELNQNLPFLVKNAKFQISTGTGTSVLPMLLDIPNLITNWSPITHIMGTKKDLLLPKMFFNSRGKVVNFQDRLSDKFGAVETSYMANQLQVSVKDNSEQDKLKKEAVEARNQAESLIHSAEKTLTDLGEKADEKMKKDVEDTLAELKSSLEDENVEDIKTKTSDLSNALMKLGEVAYKNNENATENSATNSSEDNNKDDKTNEDVVDADFEEIKPEDDKKNAS